MKQIETYFPKTFLERQGTSFDELITRLDAVSIDLEQNLNALDDERFNVPIAPNKWTVAEITDHIVRTHEVFTKTIKDVLAGEEAFEMPKGILSDEGQPTAHAFQMPVSGRARADLKQDLTASYASLMNVAREAQKQAKLASIGLVHAFLGPLTILEMLQLSAWHVRHHTKQIAA